MIQRRTPLKRSQVPLKRSPIKRKAYSIKPVAEKRAEQKRVYYEETKPAYLAAHHECELHQSILDYKMSGGDANWWPVCSKKAVEIHHMEGRENELINKVESFKAACDSKNRPKSCHCWVTEHSKQAIEIGLSFSKHKKR